MAVLAAVSLGNAGCGKASDPWAKVQGGPPYVLASFAPLYCFAKNVAGDDAGVLCLLTNTGPHDYQLTPFDTLKVRKANLFLVNGLSMDDFVLKMAGDNKTVEIFKVGDALPHELLEHGAACEHKHKDKDGKECKHDCEHDPHVWLGLEQAIAMVEKIRDKLQALDPAHKDGYGQRATAYIGELKKLQEYGKEAFKDKKNRNIITTHDSLRYFAREFELEIEDSIQPRPGIEADAVKLAKLAQVCKEKKVAAIVVEPQYRKGPAVTLQNNLRNQGVMVEIAEVDPLETIPANPQADPAFYVQQMRRNIDNLAKALR